VEKSSANLGSLPSISVTNEIQINSLITYSTEGKDFKRKPIPSNRVNKEMFKNKGKNEISLLI